VAQFFLTHSVECLIKAERDCVIVRSCWLILLGSCRHVANIRSILITIIIIIVWRSRSSSQARLVTRRPNCQAAGSETLTDHAAHLLCTVHSGL